MNENTSNASNYVLVVKVKFKADGFADFAEKWKQERARKNRNFYINEEEFSVLELTALASLEQFSGVIPGNSHKEIIAKFGEQLFGDISQELLEFQEDVVEQDALLPTDDYLQMRHIEVPLRVFKAYDDWRHETIFKHVKQLDTVGSFVAYHSLFSTKPGVMFIASFSGDPETYMSGFANDAYKEIVEQAGDRYIAGGKDGLYTKIYKKI